MCETREDQHTKMTQHDIVLTFTEELKERQRNIHRLRILSVYHLWPKPQNILEWRSEKKKECKKVIYIKNDKNNTETKDREEKSIKYRHVISCPKNSI